MTKLASMTTSRIGAAALAVGLALGISPLAAVADDILPPDGVAPVVGMAYDGSGLWLAGAAANDGVVVKAGTGEEVLSVTIDPSEVAEFRESFPVLADRRLGR